LGISSDTLLVQTKAERNGRQIDWCVDCRSCPAGIINEVPKVYHLTRPTDSETESSTDESEYYEVVEDIAEHGLGEVVEMMDLGKVILLDETYGEDSHGNADGLSRRPPED